MHKKILAAICSILIIFSYMSVPASATQSFTEKYSKLYVLTGNKSVDIVNIALAQVGKKKADFGYSEAWCADFISDCAIIAGVTDVIPPNGKVSSLYNAVLAAGGTEVATPQKGDLVFYYCSIDGYVHVGMMTDSKKSVEGNYSGKVSLVNGIYKDTRGHSLANGAVTRKFVRPAYNGSSANTGKNDQSGQIKPDPVVIKEFTEEYAGDYEVTTNSSPLTIRLNASSGSAKLGSIPKGMIIVVEKGNGDWAYTSYNGISGYISMDFLTKADAPVKGAVFTYGQAVYKVMSVSKKKVKVQYQKSTDIAASKVEIPEKFKRGSYTCTVTGIAAKAFSDCKNLTHINISSTKITSVKKNAFKGITTSTQISVPKKKYSKYISLFKKAALDSKVTITKE